MGKFIFTEIYFIGLLLVWLNTISRAVFGSVKTKEALSALLLSIIWPLALFSPKGRKRLLITTSKL